MNLDELQSVQSRERQASSLQHLRASFYEEAGEHIAGLRTKRTRAAAEADDPFDSPKVERLTDDIRTAERTVESIYERRVGKVVKLASIAAADMPYDDDGLTTEEERLFERLVDAIERNRESVLSVLDGEAPSLDCTPVEDEGSATPTDPPRTDPPESMSADPAAEASSRTRADSPDATPGTEDTTRGVPDAGPDTEPAADRRPTPPDRPTATGTDDHAPGNTHAETSGDRGDDATDGALDIGGAMGGGRDGGGPDLSGRAEPTEPAGPAEPSESHDRTEPTPGTETETDTGTSGPTDAGSHRPTDPDSGVRSPSSPTTGRAPDGPDESGTGDGDGADGPVERTTVRVTADVGDIFGVDGRSYDLSPDDVVTLPTPNAEGLVSKDAAERLD